MGKRGTNQAKSLNLSVPADSIGFWADRLSRARRRARARSSCSGPSACTSAHPCGIEYAIVGDPDPDDREPYEARVPAEHAIRGAYGTTTSVREPDPMSFFVTEGMGGELLSSEGAHHQFQIGDDRATAACSSWSRSPIFPRARGTSARARSITRRSTWSRRRTSRRSRTGSSASASPTSPSPRTAATSSRCTAAAPSGLLVEIAYGTPQGFLIDEAADELGTHMCIPPHWEDRRSEISQLEPIETIETVVG